MRKVIFGGANSLDNYIARDDGAVDWLMWSDEVAEMMKDMWSRFDCMVMGRKTYDVATGGGSEKGRTGEEVKGRKKKEVKNPYGDIETYVFSRTLRPGKRDGVEFVNSDPGKFVAKLKKKKGKDIMVMGRKTYDVATGGSESERGREGAKKKKAKTNPYGDIETYVFSRTLEPGKRDGVEFVNSDPGKFVAKLKKKKGKDIMVMGGGEIGAVLLDAGVVNEIGFNIHPILLGSGVPLFHKMSRSIDLELTECKPMKNGCVYVLYSVKN